MRTIRSGLVALALVAFLTACGAPQASAPAATTQPTGETMMEKPTDAAMMEKPTDAAMMEKPTDAAMMEKPTDAAMMEKPTDAAMMEKPTDAAMMERAAWLDLPLTDVATGESFTLASFAGRPVYVETMATWCPNCKSQLMSVQEAIGRTQEQKPVFVAISVETTLPAADLAQYASDNGFEMVFAVATPELLQALAETYGRTITNPPSTPHFIIDAAGHHGELMTGASSADTIGTLIEGAAMGAMGG
jgi:thiol-disulfide isomerase/thioredoxin